MNKTARGQGGTAGEEWKLIEFIIALHLSISTITINANLEVGGKSSLSLLHTSIPRIMIIVIRILWLILT